MIKQSGSRVYSSAGDIHPSRRHSATIMLIDRPNLMPNSIHAAPSAIAGDHIGKKTVPAPATQPE